MLRTLLEPPPQVTVTPPTGDATTPATDSTAAPQVGDTVRIGDTVHIYHQENQGRAGGSFGPILSMPGTVVAVANPEDPDKIDVRVVDEEIREYKCSHLMRNINRASEWTLLDGASPVRFNPRLDPLPEVGSTVGLMKYIGGYLRCVPARVVARVPNSTTRLVLATKTDPYVVKDIPASRGTPSVFTWGLTPIVAETSPATSAVPSIPATQA